MNRITSFLALSAIVVAGAFAGTAAQASATNVTVDFKVHNGDASASTIRSGSPSSYMSGLTNPAASILPGGDDPSSGSAVFSAPAPNVGGFVQGNVTYVNASDGLSNACTFTITVSRPASSTYNLHFSVLPSGTSCIVPATDSQNNAGQFTGTVYTLTWKT
jgi:hypothetical protein